MADNGRQTRSVITVNGKITTRRRWWFGKELGSIAPADAVLDRNGATITPGVRRRPYACVQAPGLLGGWEKIIPWRAALRGKPNRKAADRLMDFVSLRQGMIRYPMLRERGWQIGSGPTESQCKLCTKRLKGHGRRWDRPNATAVAALDTLDRNGQWQQMWQSVCRVAV